VIDLSSLRTGVQASQLLADFGAEVIWVEPLGGSPIRDHVSFPMWGRGKQSIELNLRENTGRETLRSLVATADVLVESFRPGVMERLGLSYESLAKLNPRLVWLSITGFGPNGPMANVKGYEGVVMAKLGGFQAFRAMTDTPAPPFVATQYASFSASQTGLHGVLSALVERERSGLGQKVETNLALAFASLDTWAWYMHLVATRWPDAFRGGTAFDANGVPAGPMTYMLLIAMTRDGHWLQFAQVAPHLYAALMKALGLDWMFTDPYWKGIPVFDDAERRLELWNRMLESANQKTLAEWEAIFDADPNVFAEVFRRGDAVLDHPQLVHDGHVVTIDDVERGPVRQPAALAQLDVTPASLNRSAPRLGEHRLDLAALSSVGRSAAPSESSTASPDALRQLPLEGVTVLELAVLFAAPYGATVLTDLGARVIKVEALEGDPIRNMMPFPEAAGARVMQGKESVTVNITTPEGLAIVHQLAKRADLVLQGYRAGVAERLGVDSATLHAINPDLVYVNAPGYGIGPPNGHRPAFAPSIAAAGGLARANVGDSVLEEPGLDLAEIRRFARILSAGGTITNAQADGLAALGVGTALLVGLLARQRGAGGQTLLTSMLSTASHAMSDQVIDYPGAPSPRRPDDALHGLGARYRVYEAATGWVFLAAPMESEWKPLAAALESYTPLATDPRFATEADRAANDDALSAELAKVFGLRTDAEWERDLLAVDVACVAVTTETPETLLWSDEFGRASGYLVDVDHPTFDHHPRLAPTVQFSRSLTQAEPGVLAGTATDAVLTELGYSPEAIADLRAKKIIG